MKSAKSTDTRNHIQPHEVIPRARTRIYRSQRGFMMEQLGLVIIIGALLVGAAVLAFINLRKSASISENSDQIINIAEQAKKLYGSRNVYGDVTTAIGVRSLVPAQLRDGAAATATNKFGAPITFAVATSGTGGANDLLRLTWGNVPRNQCEDLVLNASSVMRRITVGANAVVKALDTAIDTATLSAACDAADNTQIVFDIGR